jgi:glutamate dehydrogenase/leucine dehydrogenase
VATALGARWVEAREAELTECDVLAPCALGGVIDSSNLGDLRCRIVCGSANNVLAEDRLAVELAGRGILYAPDFVANAGGLINVYGELRGCGQDRLCRLVDGIGETMRVLLEAAHTRSITPLDAARALAGERLGTAALAA